LISRVLKKSMHNIRFSSIVGEHKELVMTNDFKEIEQSIEKYLKQEIKPLTMINSIEMFANSTFDTSETREFYNFLINSVGDIEILYFMKGEEYLYHDEVIKFVLQFKSNLQKYKKFIDGACSSLV